MTDQMDDLMKAAEACVAEATPETLEPGKLRLVKGEFSSLEEALRAQVQQMEAELTELKTHNKLMLGMIADRDTKLITQKKLINQLSGRIEELHHRHFEETPITFEDDE